MAVVPFLYIASLSISLLGHCQTAFADFTPEWSPNYIDMRRDLRMVDRVFEDGFRQQENQADLPSPDQHPLMLSFGSAAARPLILNTPSPYRFGVQGGITRGIPQAKGFDFGVSLESPSSRLAISFVEETWVANDDVTRSGQLDSSDRGISQRGMRGDWESHIGIGTEDVFSDAWRAVSAAEILSSMQLRYYVQAEVSDSQYLRSYTASSESGWHAAGRFGVGVYVPGLLQVKGGVTTGIPGDSALAVRPVVGVELFFWRERIAIGAEILGSRQTLRIGSRIAFQ